MDDPSTLIQSLQTLPYGGIFILFLLANAALPLPEEVFIVSLGYVGGIGLTNLFIAVPIAIAGFFISDTILFSLARSDNKYIARLRKRVLGHMHEKELNRIKTHITKIIFFSRFLVSIRFIGPVLAGTTKTSYKTFFFYNTIALLIYVPLLSWIGYFFHERIDMIITEVGAVRHYFLLASVTVIFLLFGQTLRGKLFSIINFFSRAFHESPHTHMDITITEQTHKADGWQFAVTIHEDGEPSVHTVSLSEAYYQQLTGGVVSPAECVRMALHFLLEKESKEAILPSFALSDIPTYFSTFEDTMKKRVQ